MLIHFALALTTACTFAAAPDFGANVLVLDPGHAGAQEQIDAIFKEQERAQFGDGRHAILLLPGTHELDIPVGFYTHVAGARAGNPADPVVAHDLFCRAGGYGHGKARRMVTVHTPGMVGDNFWLWRADHGAMNGWDESTCETGLLVEGDDVTIRGLFVEHTQGYQTVWNGERGRAHFYQSEMPYDPPSAGAWRSPCGDGFASYKVGDGVRAHEGIGLGVYHVFKKAAVVADRAIEVPESPGVRLRHAFTFRLGGGLPGSGIRKVVNRTGGESITAQKATLVAYPPRP